MEIIIISLAITTVLSLANNLLLACDAHRLRKRLINKEIEIMNLQIELRMNARKSPISEAAKRLAEFGNEIGKIGVVPGK